MQNLHLCIDRDLRAFNEVNDWFPVYNVLFIIFEVEK